MRIIDKETIIPCFLFFPILSIWLLPSSIEDKFILNIIGLKFYLPNIFYLLYILNYYKIKNYDYAIRKRNRLKPLFLFMLIYAILHLFSYYGLEVLNDIPNIVLNNTCYIWAPYIMLFYPLSKESFQRTKPVLLFALIVLCFEVILFSLGILTYTSAEGNELTNADKAIAGVMRIPTTIASATGTAIGLILLGIVATLYNYRTSIVRFCSIILVTIAIFFTMSRSSIAVWIIFLMLYFYFNYFLYVKLKNKIYSLFIVGVIVGLLAHYGVFAPILERIYIMNFENRFMESRIDKVQLGWDIIHGSQWMGVGCSQVFPSNILQDGTINVSHYAAAHNSYIILLAELGVLGFIPFLFIVIYLLLYQNYKQVQAKIIPIIFIIIFMTEGVPLHEIFLPMIMFLGTWNLTDKINLKQLFH